MLEHLPLATNRVVFFLLLALAVASLTCRLLTHVALRIGLADRPGGRKQHEGTIPLTGGIGMFAGFALAALTSGLILGPTLDNEMLRLAIPLAAAEDGGDFALSRDFAGLPPGTRALILMPLAPFRDGTANLGAIVERVTGG